MVNRKYITNATPKSPLRRPSKCSGTKCVTLTVFCVLLLCGAVLLIAKINRARAMANMERKIKFNITEFNGEHLYFSFRTGDCGYDEGYDTSPVCKCDTIGCINIYDSGRCHVTSVNMHNSNYKDLNDAEAMSTNFSVVSMDFIHFGEFVATALRKWRPHLCDIISRNNNTDHHEDEIFNPDLRDDVKIHYDSRRVYQDASEVYNDIRAVVDEYMECIGAWYTTSVRHWRLQFRYAPLLSSTRPKITGRQYFEWSGNDYPWPEVMAETDGDHRLYRFGISVANGRGKRFGAFN